MLECGVEILFKNSVTKRAAVIENPRAVTNSCGQAEALEEKVDRFAFLSCCAGMRHTSENESQQNLLCERSDGEQN